MAGRRCILKTLVLLKSVLFSFLEHVKRRVFSLVMNMTATLLCSELAGNIGIGVVRCMSARQM
jgi:hypothetical protein